MPTCESSTGAALVLMVIQFAAIIFAVLIAMGFLQRGLKAATDWLWSHIVKACGKSTEGEA